MISQRHTWAAVALLAAGCGGAVDGAPSVGPGASGAAGAAVGSGGNAPSVGPGASGAAGVPVGSGGNAPSVGPGPSGAAGDSGTQNVCGALACGPAMKAIVPVYYVPAMDLRGAQVDVCRNGLCVRASQDPSAPQLTGPFPRSDGDPLVEAQLSRTGGNDYELQVSYTPSRPSDVADGDTYRIQLFDVMGKMFASVEQAVTYATVYPNGPGCPGECKEATIGTPHVADAGSDAPPPVIHCLGKPTCDYVPNGECQLRPLCEFYPPYYPDSATCGQPGSIYCAVEPGFCIARGGCDGQLTEASCIANPGCAWWP